MSGTSVSVVIACVLVGLGASARAEPARAPTVPPGCTDDLRRAGLHLSPWPAKPVPRPGGVVCEVPEGIAIARGATGLRFAPPARVNCAFGQRLAKFETVLQEEARDVFRSKVSAVEQLGTYNCRRMAAYPDLVSEHSFANAIDIAVFILANGNRIVVERDWVAADRPTTRAASVFLRRLTRRLFDQHIFNVVLTPSYDSHHKNHLHLDGAAYIVDGTCPTPPCVENSASRTP
jgi:hypothetical protein